jgi:chaperonin GroEL (HSP60 family)
VLAKGIYSALSSKVQGLEEIVAPLVAEACRSVMPENTFNFNVDNVRTVKLLGGSLQQSEVVRGIVINHPPVGTARRASVRGHLCHVFATGHSAAVANAKVAVFTCALETSATETKGTVLIESAEELLNYNEGEETMLHAVRSRRHLSEILVILLTRFFSRAANQGDCRQRRECGCDGWQRQRHGQALL